LIEYGCRDGDHRAHDFQPLGEFRSAETKSTNPKDILAVNRTPLHLLPGPAKIHQALAHLDGAKKYGPYNWRAEGVTASLYKSGVERHIDDWFDGEDLASDSLVHHLGHAMAGLAIILDSIAQGNFIDDRPTPAPTGAMHSLVKPFLGGECDFYLYNGEQFQALVEDDGETESKTSPLLKCSCGHTQVRHVSYIYSCDDCDCSIFAIPQTPLASFSDKEIWEECCNRGLEVLPEPSDI
jgi:hypothetical protein